jgi:uncharacterized protein (DUF1499 family)
MPDFFRVTMKKRLRTILVCLLVIALLPVVSLAMLSFFSRKPHNLGVVNGRLADCPSSPNCVCTQATDPDHRMEPISFTGSPAEAMARLKAVVAAMPRSRIVIADERYMHAEFSSRVFRFVDDVEFLIDPDTKTIHFRSASRVGRSDLGVNRQRMEDIRQKFGER